MSSKANKEDLSRGIIYEYSNNIRHDPTHPLYPKLSSHDGKYTGASIHKSVEERYAGDVFKNHHNKHILEAFKKFGKENFSVEIIATPLLKDLWREEARWIEINDCVYPNGYNIRPGGSRDYKPHRYKVKRWVRNIKTDKVFEVPSMKEFCHNPSKFDADYESSKKFLTVDLKSNPIINLQQLSNAFTGYITPSDRSLGMKQAAKVVCAGLYTPARYTLKDIEKLKDYKHKVKVLEITKSMNYPLSLIDIVSLDEKVISNDSDVIDLLALTGEVTVCRFKAFLRSLSHEGGKRAALHSGNNLYRPKELFFKGTHWWKHNTDGSSSKIYVVVKESNETMFFNYSELVGFAKKLKRKVSKGYTNKVASYSSPEDLERSTFGRCLRSLIECELKTAYGLKVDDKKCDSRIRLLRFFSSPEVAYCKKAGYDVNFDMEGLSETERYTCEKILKLRADMYHD